MAFSVYLYFDGACGEAFDFYHSVFGGDIPVRQTYGDGPPEMGIADKDKDRVMHVTLAVGDSVLMGSDTVSGFGEPPTAGTNFAVSFSPTSKEQADKVFAQLCADGGAVTMPMADMFWGAYFGMCKDKYGVHWMLKMHQS